MARNYEVTCDECGGSETFNTCDDAFGSDRWGYAEIRMSVEDEPTILDLCKKCIEKMLED